MFLPQTVSLSIDKNGQDCVVFGTIEAKICDYQQVGSPMKLKSKDLEQQSIHLTRTSNSPRKRQRTPPSEPREVRMKKQEKKQSYKHLSEANLDLPLKISNTLTLKALGKIILDGSYISDDKTCIFPVGYCIIRKYSDISSPRRRTDYENWICKGKECPVFKLKHLDTGQVWSSSTPIGCWEKVFAILDEKRSQLKLRSSISSISGPDLMGLTIPKIRTLLRKQSGYDDIRQKFLKLSCY